MKKVILVLLLNVFTLSGMFAQNAIKINEFKRAHRDDVEFETAIMYQVKTNGTVGSIEFPEGVSASLKNAVTSFLHSLSGLAVDYEDDKPVISWRELVLGAGKPPYPVPYDEIVGKIDAFCASHYDSVDNEVVIYYVVDTDGKVSYVYPITGVDEKLNREIVTFLKSLKGLPVGSTTYVDYMWIAKGKINETGERIPQPEVNNDGRTAIGTFDVRGGGNGEILRVKEVAQVPEPLAEEGETKVFDVVEQMPSFPGGLAALMKYLSQNVQYPKISQDAESEGRVVVSFIVERDGSISDVRVVRSVEYFLDQESVRVVSSMPHWTPGKQNGETVRVKYNIPISFRLQ